MKHERGRRKEHCQKKRITRNEGQRTIISEKYRENNFRDKIQKKKKKQQRAHFLLFFFVVIFWTVVQKSAVTPPLHRQNTEKWRFKKIRNRDKQKKKERRKKKSGETIKCNTAHTKAPCQPSFDVKTNFSSKPKKKKWGSTRAELTPLFEMYHARFKQKCKRKGRMDRKNSARPRCRARRCFKLCHSVRPSGEFCTTLRNVDKKTESVSRNKRELKGHERAKKKKSNEKKGEKRTCSQVIR